AGACPVKPMRQQGMAVPLILEGTTMQRKKNRRRAVPLVHYRGFARRENFTLRKIVVRKEGFEPPRPFGHKILSLARLPVPPLPQWWLYSTSLRLGAPMGFGASRYKTGRFRYEFPG